MRLWLWSSEWPAQRSSCRTLESKWQTGLYRKHSYGKLPLPWETSSALICIHLQPIHNQRGPRGFIQRHALRPASKCARLNTESETGFAADSALLGSGGTVTVLLGSTSIGTAALSGAGRRLLALTSTFSVTITVPAGTAAGSQVPCMQGLSHPML